MPTLMEFSLSHYLIVSLILFASSVVQGAVGFAAGLFGIPLLVLTGISFPSAVAISLVAAAAQNCIPVWQLRREINWRAALRPMLIRLATLPLGVYALYLVGRESQALSSQLVGVIVLAIVIVQRTWQVEPQTRLHVAWEWLAFGLGGFLLGLCGMGGPPMVLWVLAHDWPMNRSRAFLFFIFATGIPPQALLLWLFFGTQILPAMWLGVLVLPAVVAGLYVGLLLARLIPERVLRTLSLAVLVLIALCALVGPYFP
jgi:uncharacterized protein